METQLWIVIGLNIALVLIVAFLGFWVLKKKIPGEKEGYKRDLEEGQQEGFTKGEKEGYKRGLEEGQQEGFTKGFAAGKEQGIGEGQRMGEEEGFKEGCKCMLSKLVFEPVEIEGGRHTFALSIEEPIGAPILLIPYIPLYEGYDDFIDDEVFSYSSPDTEQFDWKDYLFAALDIKYAKGKVDELEKVEALCEYLNSMHLMGLREEFEERLSELSKEELENA